jgi:PAS domain-containing protein
LVDAFASYRFGPYALVLFITTIFALLLAYLAWRRRDVPAGRYLFLFELAAAEWALAGAFEAAATTVPLKVLWSQISYLGIVITPVAGLLFALAYTHRTELIRPRNLLLLYVVPVGVLVAAASNHRHGLLWPSVSLHPQTGMGVYDHGPIFWLNFVYCYGLIALGLLMLIQSARRSPEPYRAQVYFFVFGSLLPVLGNLLYVTGLNPVAAVDWTPAGFAAFGGALLWAMHRWGMLDVMPVARHTLIDTMRDGVLVANRQGRVVDANPAMVRMLGRAPEELIGLDAGQVLEEWGVSDERLARDAAAGAALTQGDGELEISRVERTGDSAAAGAPAEALAGADTAGDETLAGTHAAATDAAAKLGAWYHVQREPLRDKSGRITGRLMVFRDITARRRLERERVTLIDDLRRALAEVKELTGLLPICARCKRIRDDGGYWQAVEIYLRDHSNAQFTHGICPECADEMYDEMEADLERMEGGDTAGADTASIDAASAGQASATEADEGLGEEVA